MRISFHDAAKPRRRGNRRRPARALRPRTATPAGALVALVVLAGCKTPPPPSFPEPLRPPMEQPAPAELASEPPPRVSPTPGVVVQQGVVDRVADGLGAGLTGEPIVVSFHDLPVSSFINEVFAKQLGLSFHIAPELQARTDLVTLKLTEPVPPRQLFDTARAVLGSYGIDIAQIEDVLTFTARPGDGGEVPLLVSGRTLPEVPAAHRTVFQLVPLRVIKGLVVSDVLRAMFGQSLRVDFGEAPRVVLRGPAHLVAQANALIDVLDQPLLRGRHGVVIAPTASDVEPLVDDLTEVLRAEGYQVSKGGRDSEAVVVLLPLGSTNKLVVFANDEDVLGHVQEWADVLDDERRQMVENGVFVREVRNTQAHTLAETLGALYDEGSLIVDKNRNVLLFRGSGSEWARLLPVIDELDKPVPSVLIEVLLAEVSLTDQSRSGLEFFLRGTLGDKAYSGGTVGRLVGKQSGGLAFALNRGGDARAVLNAFYEDTRVVIHSRPSMVVKSGSEAQLSAGNTIPTVAQRVESATNLSGQSNILQQVDYRDTGVELTVLPIVQSNGLVDVTITQTLSEARPTAPTSQAGSPTILRRTLTTTMTLRDGGSVLMAGLISDNSSGGQTGVPWLGKLPGLGRLFRVDSRQRDRTELLVLVTPYVIADHPAGRELTERMKAALRLHGPSAE